MCSLKGDVSVYLLWVDPGSQLRARTVHLGGEVMARAHDAAGHMASTLEVEMNSGAKLALSVLFGQGPQAVESCSPCL